MSFTVKVARPEDGGGYGIDLHKLNTGGVSLNIIQVNPGPVADWNEANPEKPVLPHDRILTVNGKWGEPAELLIVRPYDPNDAPKIRADPVPKGLWCSC